MAGKPEQDIAHLETLLRQLEKEYDQFFSGLVRREPAAAENAVLAIMRAYGGRPIQNSSLAFKLNSLVARYNSFRTVWTRRLREKEEGRPGPAAAPRPAAAQRQERRRQAHTAANPAEYLTSDPMHEARHLSQFFETYRRLREECGEPVDKLRAESFQRALAEKVDKIKRERGCEAVLVRVVADGGRTRIVAKPFRRRTDRAGAAP
jgi:hypothetical protein